MMEVKTDLEKSADLINSPEILPDAVENVPVREDPDVEVWRQDLVKSRNLLISKESVGHPDLPSIGESQVADLV